MAARFTGRNAYVDALGFLASIYSAPNSIELLKGLDPSDLQFITSIRDFPNFPQQFERFIPIAQEALKIQKQAPLETPVAPPVAPPPLIPTPTEIAQTATTPIPQTQIFPTTLAPSVEKLLPKEEVKPFEETALQEEALLEAARARLLQEQEREQALIEEQAQREQQALEAARARFLQEEEAAVPQTVQRFRDVYRPGIEESLKRTRDIFGGRGIGTGGFESSGALQELARRGAQDLETQATSQALQGLLEARRQYGQLGLEAARLPSIFGRTGLERQLGIQEQFRGLGLEAARIPSIFRRSAFERGLEGRDIARESALERELAQLGAASMTSTARAQARGSRGGALGSAFGAGVGGIFGGLPGAYLGSQLGGSLGRLF